MNFAITRENNGMREHYLHHVRDGESLGGQNVSLPKDTDTDKYFFAYVSGCNARLEDNVINRG